MGTSKGYISKPRNHCPARNLLCSQANVLITSGGYACLADFSLLTMVSDQSTVIPSCIEGGTIQWMSPELIYPESFDLEKIRPTKESDWYALGMVIYEVLSGQTPFTPWRAPLVIQKVLNGERPGRPRGEGGARFTDGIWEMLELCWKHRPGERTGAKTVLQCLERASSLPWPPPDMDEIVETDVDERSDAATSGSGMFSVSTTVSQTHPQLPPWHSRPDNYTWRKRPPGSITKSSSSCDSGLQHNSPTSIQFTCLPRQCS